jgi:hypothetical protein
MLFAGIMLSIGSLLTLSMATVLQEFIMGKDNSVSSHQTLHPMSLVFYTTPVEVSSFSFSLVSLFLSLSLTHSGCVL